MIELDTTIKRLFLALRCAQSILGFYPICTEEIHLYHYSEPSGKLKLMVSRRFTMTLVSNYVDDQKKKKRKSPFSVT